MRGYIVKLIAPQFIKRYGKSSNNEANEEAICEAISHPNMRLCRSQDTSACYFFAM